MPFEDTAEDYDLTKQYPLVQLNKFYDAIADYDLPDETAIEYMTSAAKMSCIKFESETEMMSYKADF